MSRRSTISLFLLCTEGLTTLLTHAVEINQVPGIQIYRNTPQINHLFFIDNKFFLQSKCRKSTDPRASCKIEQVSGQQINKAKTYIFFSKNVASTDRKEIMFMWDVHEIQQPRKYLGLLSMVRKNKNMAFSDLRHKVWQKLQGWKEKLLSQGVREILVKAMTLSIPTSTMGCFRLPTRFCNKLEKMMASFWWGQKQGKKNSLGQLGEVCVYSKMNVTWGSRT